MYGPSAISRAMLQRITVALQLMAFSSLAFEQPAYKVKRSNNRTTICLQCFFTREFYFMYIKILYKWQLSANNRL